MHALLETNRLVLRKFTVEDAPFMFRLVNEPSWIENIGDRNVHSIEDAQKYLADGAISSYTTHGYGFYIVLHRETNLPIGTCGFAKRPFLDHPDFGFAFLPEYTGQGYAIEIAVATMAFAEEVLKMEKLVAFTTPSNKRSIQLLIKLGFRFEKSIMVEEEELFLFGAPLMFVHKEEED